MREQVSVEIADDGIALVRLQRPPVNALTPEFLSQIDGVFAEIGSDGRVRAVVLTGSGRVLSAGMDLKEVIGFGRSRQMAMYDGLNKCFSTMYELPKPLIVAANGHAIAGGLFFVLCGDCRVVSDQAMLGLTEVRVGVDFPEVAREIAVHELGASGARRLMLSGKNVSAHKAHALNIVDEVCDAERVLARARACALDYAHIPPQTFAAVKRQVRQDVITRYTQALDAGRERDGWFNDETQAAAQALLAAAAGKASG